MIQDVLGWISTYNGTAARGLTIPVHDATTHETLAAGENSSDQGNKKSWTKFFLLFWGPLLEPVHIFGVTFVILLLK